MINPAQYTAVLQKASDGQLMQMLKRPDKIPSQFVVAEINRRQSMRQAAMADQQRQARVQEMMTAQQQMPQQQMPQQQPMGMSIGGPTLITALGGNINSPIPDQVGIDPFDPARETYMEYLARVGDAKNVARLATEDSGMVTDQGPPAEEAPDAPVFDNVGIKASAPYATNVSKGPDGPSFAQKYIFGREFGGTDRNPLRMAQGEYFDKQEVIDAANKMPLDPGIQSAIDARRAKGIRSATNDMINTNMAVREAEGMYAGTGNLKSKAGGIRQGDTGGPIDYEPGSTDFSSALGMGRGANNNKAPDKSDMDRTKTASESAAQALSAFSVDITAVNNKDKGVKTPGVVTGKDSQANTAPSGGGTSDGTTSGGITNTGTTTPNRSIDTTRVDTGSDKETPSQKSLAEQVAASNKATLSTLAGGYDNLAAADRRRAKVLEGELLKVTTAMEDMAKIYDQNATTPENRIFRSMIDMGLALAGSKENNFMIALAESGKTGLQTFDRLNNEEKERLFKKYGAAVDLARTRADITGQINGLLASADRTSLEGQTKVAEGEIADRGVILSAQQSDIQNQQQDRKAEQTDVSLSTDVETKEVGMEQTDTKLDQGQQALDQGQQQIDLSRDRLQLDADLGQQRIDVQREGNDIQLFLGGKKLELQALTAAASNATNQERNAIDRFIANKPAASVAYLDEVASRFGEDVAKQMILGKNSNGMDIDNSSITTTARTFAISDFEMQPKIPGVEPENDDGTYSQGQYFDHHLKNIRTSIYGSAPGGSSGSSGQAAAGPADDTLDFED